MNNLKIEDNVKASILYLNLDPNKNTNDIFSSWKNSNLEPVKLRGYPDSKELYKFNDGSVIRINGADITSTKAYSTDKSKSILALLKNHNQ